MSISDQFGEMNLQNHIKTAFGDPVIRGVKVGRVISNYSEEYAGKICVNMLEMSDGESQVRWVRVASLYGGKKQGISWRPEIDDLVLLVFEDGNPDKAIAIGSVYPEDSTFLKKMANEGNPIKILQTKRGSYIAFDDGNDEEGADSQVSIATSQEQHKFLMDNGKKKITLQDKEQNSLIELETEKGIVRIQALKRIEFSTGDVKIVMDGNTGKIKIIAKSLTTEVSDSLKLKTDGSWKASGQQVTLEGTTTTKVTSGGMTGVEGKPVKIN